MLKFAYDQKLIGKSLIDGSLFFGDTSTAIFKDSNGELIYWDSSSGNKNIGIGTDVSSATNVPSGHEVFAGKSNNVAFIKQLLAGTGAEITSDASSITISFSGGGSGSNIFYNTNVYTNTFDGTSDTSLNIPYLTHGLTNDNSILVVNVFDGDELVFPNIYVDPISADVSIIWNPGSLSANSRYIITGGATNPTKIDLSASEGPININCQKSIDIYVNWAITETDISLNITNFIPNSVVNFAIQKDISANTTIILEDASLTFRGYENADLETTPHLILDSSNAANTWWEFNILITNHEASNLNVCFVGGPKMLT